MFPTVTQPIEQYVTLPQNPSSKAPRVTWHHNSVLTSVKMPKRIYSNPQRKTDVRKYASIQFQYIDGITGKRKSKTVFFGEPDGQYIGDHDQAKRQRKFHRLGHQNDPFHPNYWRLHLLNSAPTLQQAYVQFVRKVVGMAMRHQFRPAKPGNKQLVHKQAPMVQPAVKQRNNLPKTPVKTENIQPKPQQERPVFQAKMTPSQFMRK